MAKRRCHRGSSAGETEKRDPFPLMQESKHLSQNLQKPDPWSVGVLECWGENLERIPDHYSILPQFHYSIFKRMTSPSSLRTP
jgi:hypothetical protein